MHRAAAVSGIHRARGEGDERLDNAAYGAMSTSAPSPAGDLSGP